MKFCQGYDIFPSLISKARLKELFTVFASFHEQSAVNKVGKRQGGGEEGRRYIDFDLLIELLITIALSQRAMSKTSGNPLIGSNIYEIYFIKVTFLTSLNFLDPFLN